MSAEAAAEEANTTAEEAAPQGEELDAKEQARKEAEDKKALVRKLHGYDRKKKADPNDAHAFWVQTLTEPSSPPTSLLLVPSETLISDSASLPLIAATCATSVPSASAALLLLQILLLTLLGLTPSRCLALTLSLYLTLTPLNHAVSPSLCLALTLSHSVTLSHSTPLHHGTEHLLNDLLMRHLPNRTETPTESCTGSLTESCTAFTC